MPSNARPWVRYLTSVGVATEVICALLGIDALEVDACLAPGMWDRPPLIPAVCKGKRPINHRPILAQTAVKVRRLSELGFGAPAIAVIMVLRPRAVSSFLKRVTPVRKSGLSRPRTKREQVRVDATLRRREERRKAAADRKSWANNGANHDDDGCEAPPPPAVELIVDQVVADVAPPPAANVWVGPTNLRGGEDKLSPELAAEVRTRHAAGWSVHELALDYDVSRNTIYRVLRLTMYRPVQDCPESSQ